MIKRRPGRPPSPNPATVMATIKLTPDQKAKYVELGAGRWVKRLLNEALAVQQLSNP